MAESPAIIHATSFWEEPINRTSTAKTPKRSAKKSAADLIADYVSLGKAITLCRRKCVGKFNAPGNGYALYKEVTGVNHCISRCQGCNETFAECNTFLKTSEI